MLARVRTHLTTIVVAMVVAAVTAGGAAVAGQIVNADKVDGYHANQLTRASRAVSNGVPLRARRGDSGTVLTADISAPKKGFLVISASSDVWAPNFLRGGTQFSYDCWIGMDEGYLNASVRTSQVDPSADGEDNCATNIAWPVASGQHEVRLEYDTGGTVIFDESALDVVYVPFNGTGKVPDPKPVDGIKKPALGNS